MLVCVCKLYKQSSFCGSVICEDVDASAARDDLFLFVSIFFLVFSLRFSLFLKSKIIEELTFKSLSRPFFVFSE